MWRRGAHGGRHAESGRNEIGKGALRMRVIYRTDQQGRAGIEPALPCLMFWKAKKKPRKTFSKKLLTAYSSYPILTNVSGKQSPSSEPLVSSLFADPVVKLLSSGYHHISMPARAFYPPLSPPSLAPLLLVPLIALKRPVRCFSVTCCIAVVL